MSEALQACEKDLERVRNELAKANARLQGAESLVGELETHQSDTENLTTMAMEEQETLQRERDDATHQLERAEVKRERLMNEKDQLRKKLRELEDEKQRARSHFREPEYTKKRVQEFREVLDRSDYNTEADPMLAPEDTNKKELQLSDRILPEQISENMERQQERRERLARVDQIFGREQERLARERSGVERAWRSDRKLATDLAAKPARKEETLTLNAQETNESLQILSSYNVQMQNEPKGGAKQGDFVELYGLQNDQLNGRKGRLFEVYEDGWKVNLSDDGQEEKGIRLKNLGYVLPADESLTIAQLNRGDGHLQRYPSVRKPKDAARRESEEGNAKKAAWKKRRESKMLAKMSPEGSSDQQGIYDAQSQSKQWQERRRTTFQTNEGDAEDQQRAEAIGEIRDGRAAAKRLAQHEAEQYKKFMDQKKKEAAAAQEAARRRKAERQEAAAKEVADAEDQQRAEAIERAREYREIRDGRAAAKRLAQHEAEQYKKFMDGVLAHQEAHQEAETKDDIQRVREYVDQKKKEAAAAQEAARRRKAERQEAAAKEVAAVQIQAVQRGHAARKRKAEHLQLQIEQKEFDAQKTAAATREAEHDGGVLTWLSNKAGQTWRTLTGAGPTEQELDKAGGQVSLMVGKKQEEVKQETAKVAEQHAKLQADLQKVERDERVHGTTAKATGDTSSATPTGEETIQGRQQATALKGRPVVPAAPAAAPPPVRAVRRGDESHTRNTPPSEPRSAQAASSAADIEALNDQRIVQRRLADAEGRLNTDIERYNTARHEDGGRKSPAFVEAKDNLKTTIHEMLIGLYQRQGELEARQDQLTKIREQDISALADKNKSRRERHNSLREALEAMTRVNNKDHARLQEQYNAVQAELAELHAELAELHAEHKRMLEQIGTNKIEIEEGQVQRQQNTDNIGTQKDRLDALEGKVKDNAQRIANMSELTKLDVSKVSRDTRQEALVKATLSQLTSDVEGVIQSNEAFQHVTKGNEQTLEDHEDRLRHLRHIREEVAALQKQVGLDGGPLQEAIAHLKGSIQRAHQVIGDNHTGMMEGLRTEAGHRKTDVASIRREIEDLKVLRNKVQGSPTQGNVSMDVQNRIDKLEQSLAERFRVDEGMQRKYEGMEREHSSINQAVTDLRAYQERARESHAADKEHVQRLIQEIQMRLDKLEEEQNQGLAQKAEESVQRLGDRLYALQNAVGSFLRAQDTPSISASYDASLDAPYDGPYARTFSSNTPSISATLAPRAAKRWRTPKSDVQEDRVKIGGPPRRYAAAVQDV